MPVIWRAFFLYYLEMQKIGLYASALLTAGTLSAQNPIQVEMDLNTVVNDRIEVEMKLGKVKSNELTFYLPMTIPGTYSIDNYGRFVSEVKGYDKKGEEVQIQRLDNNTWQITGAKKVSTIKYWVEDTFDHTAEELPFAPAGTQIDSSTFLLNLHGFVGYFKDQLENDYSINIKHPQTLYPSSSMTDVDSANNRAVYTYDRYFEVIDNPIFFTQQAPVIFEVDGVEIHLAVHSPSNKYSAKDFEEAMRLMIQAQLNFIGDVRTTNKYAILLYLTSDQKADADEFGALEHHKNTTVVFAESMDKDELTNYLIDTVSHEFFHILTPLAIHSQEIHHFDYNNPKMSKHLWMYEGVTEYFANLFQVQQGLIEPQEFLNRMEEKRTYAASYDDALSFTEMSKNILVKPYSDQFLNVYNKGALIAMCIDIIIRKDTQGEKGIIDLMRELSQNYGPNTPFVDDQLFDEITQRTSPNVRRFLDEHVAKGNPINYLEFLHQMGVEENTTMTNTMLWVSGPDEVILAYKGFGLYMHVKENTQDHIVVQTFGLQPGDQLLSINGMDANVLSNLDEMLKVSMGIEQGEEVTIEVQRGNERISRTEKIILPQLEAKVWNTKDQTHVLRNAWFGRE